MKRAPSAAGIRSAAFLRGMVLLGSFFIVQPLSASIIWDWMYTSTDYSGSGTFTTASTTVPGTNVYLVTDITGTWDDMPITGLATAGTFGGNDNLLGASLPQLDFSGLAFIVETGEYNMFYNLTQYEVCLTATCTDGVGPGNFVATAASTSSPEPAFAPLDGLLLMAIATFGVRRRRFILK